MKLLVISDLHIGKKARTKELCPYADGLLKEENLVPSFIKSAKDYQTINGKFDYLIIPGDITHSSALVEYDCGSKFLKLIISELGIPEKNVIFVPGNHDVDWSILNGIPDEERPFRTKHKYNTLKDTEHSFSSLGGDELLIDPFIKKWEFDNVIFFGFNSSWHDDSMHDKHYGLIEQKHIQKLREQFETIAVDKLKVFVNHHHLHQFDNPHPKWIDISVMQNAQALINLLSEFSFNFIIHGHRHVPNFLSTSIENFQPINILCAGSYSCEVPAEIAGYVGNMFHIIEIDDFSNIKCKGRIKSMAYDLNEGWIQSKPSHGIEYENPFGNQIEFSQLKNTCIQELNTLLSKYPVVTYKKLTEIVDDLFYLPVLSRKKLFAELKQNCTCDLGTTGEDQIFIKTS